MLKKLSLMLLVAIHQRGLICMWNAGNGGWQGRNVKSGAIKLNWSKLSLKLRSITIRGVDSSCFLNREIRKKCPNSLILRELDQIASSMK
jgi:hypothetical protein